MPASAFLAGAYLAARLAVVPAAPLLVLLAVLGCCLRSAPGVAIAAGAVGLLRAETSWLAPIRASPGWDLERPLEVVFEPDDVWERRDGDWSAVGRIRWLRQDRHSEAVDLKVRCSVAAEDSPSPARAYRLYAYLRSPLAFYNGPPTWVGAWQVRVKSARFVRPLDAARPPTMAQRARHRLVIALGAGAPGERALGASEAIGARERRGPGAALLEGLLLGRTATLPEDWQRGLRRTGLMHLFAVSGLHVSLIAGLVWTVTARARPGARAGASLLAATAYSLLVGLGPTVLRSLFMLAAVIGARFARRAPSSLNALALSAGALAAADCALVDDLSFQLTVAATAGVVGLGPWLAARWGGGALAKAVAVSVGAQLATVPFTVPSFSQLPLGGALLNLVAVPWSGLCLGLGLVWSLVALAAPSWGAVLVPWFDPSLDPSAGSPRCRRIRRYRCRSLSVRRQRRLFAIVLLVVAARPRALLVLAPLALVVSASSRPQSLEIAMLDVGQGDAILLRDRDRALLVDGGGWPSGDFGGRVLLPALARLGVRSLDAAVVSHPDADHCGGVADIASVPSRPRALDRARLAGCSLHRSPARGAGALRARALAWRSRDVASLRARSAPPRARRERRRQRSVTGHRRRGRRPDAAPDRRRSDRDRERSGAASGSAAGHGAQGRAPRQSHLDHAAVPRFGGAALGAGVGRAQERLRTSVRVVALDRLARRHAVVLRTDQHGRIRLRWREGGPLQVEVVRTPVLGETRAPRVRLGPPRLVFDSLAPP